MKFQKKHQQNRYSAEAHGDEQLAIESSRRSPTEGGVAGKSPGIIRLPLSWVAAGQLSIDPADNHHAGMV